MKRIRSLERQREIHGWLFISIPLLLILGFSIYPMVQSFFMSFQSGRGANLSFCGLDNYKRLFRDGDFLVSVRNTFIYLIFQVPIMLPLSMMIAILLNDDRLKCKGVFRTAIFLPCITSLVAFSILFKNIFAPDGIMNQLLLGLGLVTKPVPWLTDPFWAKVTVIVAMTWRWTGYNMVFFLAGLQNIDKSVYEAAAMDGAGQWKCFWNITFPLLKPMVLFMAIISTNGTLQIFDAIVNLTNGGPGKATMSISQYIYNLCFNYVPNFGYAATVAYVIVLFVGVLSILQLKAGGEKRE